MTGTITLSELTEQLARLLAERSGKTPAEVIEQALEERAHEVGLTTAQPKRTREQFIAGMKAIADRCATLPVLDRRRPTKSSAMTSTGCPDDRHRYVGAYCILQNEPERDTFFDALADASSRKISAMTMLESGLVMHGKLGQAGITMLLEFIEAKIVPFDVALVKAALDAFARYGKGVHSAARLNFGDLRVLCAREDLELAPAL